MTPLEKPVKRKTGTTLGGSYGTDSGRVLVVSIIPNPHGDLIEIKPLGVSSKRSERVTVEDVYRWALRNRVARQTLERCRLKLEKQRERRAAESRERAERKLRSAARKDRDRDSLAQDRFDGRDR
jgi:microcompartment protein CcmL/EutN